MRIKLKVLSIYFGIAMLLTALLIPTNVLASNDYGKYENKKEVKEFLKSHNVPKKEIKILISKMENNELWDSDNPEKIKEIPENYFNFDLDNESEETIKYYRFDDGSFIFTEINKLNGFAIDGSITSRQKWEEKGKTEEEYNKLLSESTSSDTVMTRGYLSGSTYSWHWDYVIKWGDGTSEYGFVTEFLIQNRAYDRFYFSDVNDKGGTHSPFGWSTGCTLSDYQLHNIRENESYGAAAKVGMSVDEACTIASGRVYVYANLQNNNLSVTTY